jgi:hypothetical protein
MDAPTDVPDDTAGMGDWSDAAAEPA